jgi:protein TonB
MSEQIGLVVSLLLWVVGLLVVTLPLALIPAQIAKKKGRSFGLWWLYGSFSLFYAAVSFVIWWAFGQPFGDSMVLLLLLGLGLAALPFVHAYMARPATPAHQHEAGEMFGQLVESSAETVGNDRLIYFFDTMGIWVTVAFLAVAITGVLLVNAQLSDQAQKATLIQPTPPPEAAQAEPEPEQPKPVEQPKQVAAPVAVGFVAPQVAPTEIRTAAPKITYAPNVTTYDQKAVDEGRVATLDQLARGIGDPNSAGGAGGEPPPPEPEPVKKPEPKPEVKLVRKSGGVLAGEATKRVEPTYPPLAKAARVSGAVVVEVIINEEGGVVSARAVSGHPLLRDPAVNAARGWRFKPTLLSGQPVKVVGTITFNFSL